MKATLMSRHKLKIQRGYVRREMDPTSTTDSGSASKRPRIDREGSVPSVNGNETDSSEAKSGNADPVEPNGSTPCAGSPLRGECQVVNVDSGTPIVTLYSPFENLPDQSKWTTNTTDHIFFENLPESTGKYENIRGILQKVRDTRRLNFDE